MGLVWRVLVGLRTQRALQATEICCPQKHVSNDEILIKIDKIFVYLGKELGEVPILLN